MVYMAWRREFAFPLTPPQAIMEGGKGLQLEHGMRQTSLALLPTPRTTTVQFGPGAQDEALCCPKGGVKVDIPFPGKQ